MDMKKLTHKQRQVFRLRYTNGGGKASQEEITSPRGSDLCNTMKLKGEALKQNDFFDSE